MPLPAETIKTLILNAIPESTVELSDLAGDNDHFKAIITSQSFFGKSRIEQHKMVFAALQGKMGTELHALSLETRVPSTTTT